MIYLYDYTFNNLLILIKYLAIHKISPKNIKNLDYMPNLFEQTSYLELKDDNAFKKIRNKVSDEIFNIIFNVFLSNDSNKEIIIYYFFVNALKYKEKVLYMRNINSVNMALKISKYVKREAHKLKGFLRFKELDNKVLYAEFESTNNVIYYLSNHFKNRLKNEYWIIKDIKRGIYSVYDKNNYHILSENDFKVDSHVSKDEDKIIEMWKDFYDTIGIESRKNDRCRMNLMPKKYWKYMIEMEDYNI